MRKLTIKREKYFAGSLTKMKVYIEDSSSSNIIIGDVAYRKIGELKNGEEKSFEINENESKVAVIADNISKNFCNDFYKIPAGEEDVFLSGKNEFNPATGNAFRFNGITDENVLKNRKKNSRKGLFILFLSIIIGGIVWYTSVNMFFSANTTVKPKDFSKSGMNITLTNQFVEKPQENYTISYDSKEVAILALKEEFSDYEGLNNYSIEQYGELVLETNKQYSPSDLKNNNGITYFNYLLKNTDTNETYKYFTVLYKASDAFWMVQFIALENNYFEYEEQFIGWAKNITFSK